MCPGFIHVQIDPVQRAGPFHQTLGRGDIGDQKIRRGPGGQCPAEHSLDLLPPVTQGQGIARSKAHFRRRRGR